MPVDSKAVDLWHWQIQFTTSDVDTIFDALLAGQYTLISSGTIDMPDSDPDFSRGLMVRDPDGHALLFLEW